MLKRILNKLGIYKTYMLSLNNHSFKIPVYNGLGMANFNDPESWMSVVLKKIGSESYTLIDVGVNVGQTLMKWKSLFSDASYVGFEPNQKCVSYVEKLIHENALTKCKIYNKAISNVSGEATLYLLGNDQGDSSASMIKDFRQNEKRTGVSVETTTFSSMKLEACDIVKIDVEGSELGVVQSLFDLAFRPVIVIEILPVYSEKNTDRLDRQHQLEALVELNNYQIFRIVKEPSVSLEHCVQIGIHSNINGCDYLFIPGEKVEIIISKFSQ